MKTLTRHRSNRRAFTLIELLVVLGVIAIFVTVFAVAIQPGNPTVAVQGSQSQFASLATQARGVAIGRGTSAAIVINLDETDDERYLRYAGVVYDDNNDPADPLWIPASDGIFLPQGAYVVPDTAPTTAPDVAWGDAPLSSFSQTDSIEYLSSTAADYGFIIFDQRGVVDTSGPGGSPVIAVSSGRPGADGTGVEFDNPNNVRGLILRRYGSFVLLNEPAAFD